MALFITPGSFFISELKKKQKQTEGSGQIAATLSKNALPRPSSPPQEKKPRSANLTRPTLLCLVWP